MFSLKGNSMILLVTQHGEQPRDMGYVLKKHPDKYMSREIPGGLVHVFFPRADDEACTCAIIAEVNAIEEVREGNAITDYVSEDPYVCGNLFLTAAKTALGTAMTGKCSDRPDLETAVRDYEFFMPSCGGSSSLARDLFGPLGYDVTADDVEQPDYIKEQKPLLCSVRLRKRGVLGECLRQVVLLAAVMSNRRYFKATISDVESVERLGEGWLGSHPMMSLVLSRFLEKKRSLISDANEKLEPTEKVEETAIDVDRITEEKIGIPAMNLHPMRLSMAAAFAREVSSARVLDIGCGEGRLTQRLIDIQAVERVTALDVSFNVIERAKRKTRHDHLTAGQQRLVFQHASVTDRHEWMLSADSAFLIEVIEHMDHHSLSLAMDNLMGWARVDTVFITTPNRDFNVNFPDPDCLRHPDHQFEFTGSEMVRWISEQAAKHRYSAVRFEIGPDIGGHRPTQGVAFCRGKGRQPEIEAALQSAADRVTRDWASRPNETKRELEFRAKESI